MTWRIAVLAVLVALNGLWNYFDGVDIANLKADLRAHEARLEAHDHLLRLFARGKLPAED